jgi:hypothetical protein
MKARFWYQRAVSLGSTEAKRRLEAHGGAQREGLRTATRARRRLGLRTRSHAVHSQPYLGRRYSESEPSMTHVGLFERCPCGQEISLRLLESRARLSVRTRKRAGPMTVIDQNHRFSDRVA